MEQGQRRSHTDLKLFPSYLTLVFLSRQIPIYRSNNLHWEKTKIKKQKVIISNWKYEYLSIVFVLQNV